MKKAIIGGILSVAISYSCGQTNQAQEEVIDPNEQFTHVIPDNGDEGCSPYFFVKSNDPLKSWMPLQSTRAYVEITGNIANVKVEQIYENKSKRKLDAIYIFPGSTRAAVYALDMTIGKRTIHAKVKEREKARKEFNEAQKAGKRATLLEQDRPNVFKMEVANIGPGEKIKVEMYYTELLECRDNLYEFVYPTAVGPRYSTTDEEYVRKSIEQLMSGHQPKFNVQLMIDAPVPVQTISSPSHAINMKRVTETQTAVNLQNPSDEQLGKDFILQYGLQGGQVQSGLTLYEHNDEKFFLLMMEPPKADEKTKVLPREYIFIVDVSGSMSGFPLEVSKTVLKKLISSLSPADRFNVLLFESSNDMMSKNSLPATPENIKKAIQVIDRQRGSGGTELYPALQAAFAYKDPSLEDYARTFIIATDGYVSVEAEAFQLIRQNLNKANFFPLGIGNGVNRHLIEGMAWAGASEPFIINNQTEAEKVGEHLIQTISQPLFTQIDIDWGDFEVYDTYPQKMPDVFSHKPMVVFGKYKGNPKGNVELKGKTVGGEFRIKMPVTLASHTKNQALRYLWARNKIKYMSDYAPYFNDYSDRYDGTDKYEKEITKLGLRYNLLTAYTSFLAVDDEMDENAKYEECKDVVRFTAPVISEDAVCYEQSKIISACEMTPPPPLPKQSSKVFEVAETMPSFPGGDQKMMEFIKKEMALLLTDPTDCAEGRVVVRFVVTETGEIDDIKVIRSVSPWCDQAAIKIVKAMPKWKPGMQNGKAVPVYFSLPIRFKTQ